MFSFLVIFGLSGLVASNADSADWSFQACHQEPADGAKPVEFILDELHRPENKYKAVALPASVDWRWANGQRYATWTRNQHIPNYCGACWAMAATSVLSDRIMIQYGNRFPEWNLAVQVLLNCERSDNGCHGGYPSHAFEYIRTHGLPSETCQPYEATGWDTGNTCADIDVCKNCDSDGSCFAQFPHQLWFIKEHAIVTGEYSMMQALQDGPITCGMQVTQAFENLVGFCGVYQDPCEHCVLQDHDISIVGYGTDEQNTDYWIIRNSWGTWWGCDGYVRVVRGINNLGLEEGCAWATPADNPVWVNSSSSNTTTTTTATKGKRLAHKACVIKPEIETPDLVLSPLPSEYVSLEALPTDFSWANYKGENLLTTARNQHIPHYCGSCWAFATTSALGDRLNLLRFSSGQSLFPEINLSPQVLINEDGGGTCNGGWPDDVYSWIHHNGIPDETCQLYQARDHPHGNQTQLDICENCSPGSGTDFWPGVCVPVATYPTYWVTEYGSVQGAANMQAEVYARGPISCLIDATDAFHAYTGGIFSEEVIDPGLNHVISVVGWGHSAALNEDYWIGRNSWGTYWGEEGFFQIKMGSDNLGIENVCSWGVPSLTKPSDRQ